MNTVPEETQQSPTPTVAPQPAQPIQPPLRDPATYLEKGLDNPGIQQK